MCNQTKLHELKQIVESKGGILVSTEYINSHSPIICIDELGNTFSILPYSLKQGRWSPQTMQSRKAKSLTKYTIQDLKNYAISKGGQCLSTEYINDKYKYTWLDSKGREFEMSWYSVYKSGYWSPFEKAEKLSKLKTKYTIEDLQAFAESFGGKCLSTEYTKSDSNYEWLDRNGRYFVRTWQEVRIRKDLLAKMRSKHEEQIDDFVQSLGLKTRSDRTILEGKELDIVIDDKKIAIEVNGVYWHTEAQGKGYKYHYDKFKACRDKGISLIQVYDIEWNERQEQIKSFLTAKLGINKTIGARKTEVRIVPKPEAKEFLDLYHIQGSCKFEKAFGLYSNDELLSLITIGKHHRGNNSYVLSRFVGKTGISVVGGLSKLTKAALAEYKELITWVDLHYSNGENWLKIGWELEAVLPPDYRYYNPSNNTFVSKQSRQKKKIGTPDNMTELEHSRLDGLTRIYDSGKLRLRISL